MLFSLGGVSIPSFFFAILLILLFSVTLGLVPATGSGSLDRLILPALVLGYEGTGLIARLTRAALLHVLGREYVRRADATRPAPRRGRDRSGRCRDCPRARGRTRARGVGSAPTRWGWSCSATSPCSSPP